MARSLVRLFPAGIPSPSPSSVDLFCFRSELAISANPTDGRTSWAVTRLLGAHRASTQSVFANDLGFALNGLEPLRLWLKATGSEGQLEGLLASFAPCRASLFLNLPRFNAGIRDLVHRVLQILNSARNLDWAVVIAVAEVPTEWAPLNGIHGFIKSKPSTLLGDAAAAMALMTTFMSPTLLTLSDELDVLAAVGDADAPSTVAILSWNYERRELTFDSERDRINVCKATTLSLSPLWAHGSWSDSHELMRQLRLHLAADATATYNTSTEHFMPSVASARCCPVVVLCKGIGLE